MMPVIFQLNTAQQTVENATKAQVAALNADLKNRYLSSFNDYVNQLLAGQPVKEPPKPPAAYVVGYEDGWAHPLVGTDPVCNMPTVPPAPGVAVQQPGFGSGQNPNSETSDLAALNAKVDKLLAFFGIK